jgi:hypothetical protein
MWISREAAFAIWAAISAQLFDRFLVIRRASGMLHFGQGQIRHNSLRSAFGTYSVFPLPFGPSFRCRISMGFLAKTLLGEARRRNVDPAHLVSVNENGIRA